MTPLLKWSVADYHRMIAAGILRDRRVELLAGDIVELSPEGPLHASRLRKVANYLRGLLNEVALVSEAHPITLQQSEPEPDIAIVRLPESLYDDRHPSAEDVFWLIEIADTTLTTDLNQKKQLYALEGIPEYWVLDVKAKHLTIFRQPVGSEYAITFQVSEANVAPEAFPEAIVLLEKLTQ